MMKGYIFLDVGGTQVKSAAFSETGDRLCPVHSVPSLAGEDRDTILSNLLSVIEKEKQCLVSAGLSPDTVGFAFPGPFDYPEGISRMQGLNKYESIRGVPLREALLHFPGQQAITPDTRMFFRHDIASFAMGEASRSLSGETPRIFCLCIGTGAGSAFLENGKLLDDDPRVPEHGWIYSSPLRGATIDDWVSARGLAKLAESAGFTAGTDGKELYRMVADGNGAAREVWRQFGVLIAEAAAPFIRSFRPQMLLFGGQIAGATEYFGPAVQAAYPELRLSSVPNTTESIFRGLRASMTIREYRRFRQYDRFPSIPVRGQGLHAAEGWSAILEELRKRTAGSRHILVCELYPGVNREEMLENLRQLGPARIIDTTDLLLPRNALFERLYGDQGDDRVFGYMTHRQMADCFDPEKIREAREEIASAGGGLTVVCGTGASLVTRGDTLLYANLTRWEIQLRYRAGQGNWGLDNGSDPLLTKYKYGYFVLWRIADRLKASLFSEIDLMMDTDKAGNPKMITGETYRLALSQAARQPFRTQPYFDPGVWGGQWLRNTLGIPTDADNLAWGFDGVPEENALGFTVGETRLVFPCMDLVLAHPHELLGERVHGRFGAEFPIRFDFLDTMEGGNLSLQVHPLTEYIQQTFGMHYTQDESYYILDADAEKNPTVCLGVRTGVQPGEMLADLREAQAGGRPFDAKKYINHIPVKKHDHLLIPAGTIHCSGANTVVLEISATPYIFTFKLWDWGRLGLDGLPRPIHISHGEKNIQWDRDTEWVHSQLVNRIETVYAGEGVLAERTGLHAREFLETVRYTLSIPHTCGCRDSVHVLNLVEGKDMRIDSPDGTFEPFRVHYAETVIIPACVGAYRLCPTEDSPEIMVIDACVR